MPLIQINLDILYSKVLGPIKQGTLQGVFIACAQILNVVGPLTFSYLYTLYGPRILWGLEIGVCSFAIVLFIFFYPRMIPWSERVAEMAADSTIKTKTVSVHKPTTTVTKKLTKIVNN